MALPHTLLTDGAHDEHITFWTSALGAVTGDFHMRHPWLSAATGPRETFHEVCPLTPDARAVVEDISRGQDLGVVVIVTAAVSFLLETCTQAPVVTIDTPSLSHPGAAPEDQRIPLVTTIDRSLTIREYLAQVSAMVSRSYSLQDFPIGPFCERLLKRTRPGTNVALLFPGVHQPLHDAATYDLQIVLSRDPGLTITLAGQAPAFTREYLKTFAHHLSQVIKGFADRSTRLDDIDVMGDEERTRVLVTYNAAQHQGVSAHTIPELFEQQAARAGSHPAILHNDTIVTFDTLNRRANQLARFLQSEYGVQPGDVIGVLTHRAPATIVGLLGVLKAGAVYLPIDPDYPEERLQFMVADAGVKVLLVHSEHFDRLMSLYDTPMFALDIQLEGLATEDADLAPCCSAGDLAYIIYTSGSTGQPKAVLLEHRGFVTMVQHHIGVFALTPSDRFLQFYGLSFDSSLFEVFVPLLAGATVVLVDRATIDDPEQLSAYIEAQQVTTLTLPPVYSSALNRDRVSSVTRYVSAGDHCRVEDARRFARSAAYFNSYGPTETSVCVTHYQVNPDQVYGSRIPVGKPISGTSIYLLDPQRRPVPDAVVGEICIGGAGLARGYLHRDDLTTQAFVPNPFAPGERLYLTGDLGVWLPDGNLEVIGRKDNQVKIRGYRIELGEIESVLDQHPQVKESAVLAKEDDQAHRRLVAYVTGRSAVDVDDLRTLLRSRLPAYMMPSAFVLLEQMPLTANGKIDRKALAAIADQPDVADVSAGLPRNPIEERLVSIWQEVLGVPSVGIHDNLFDLGGDSILIIQIVSRAREAGLKLAPNQLFDHQTIATLAEVAVATPSSTAPAAEQHTIEGPAALAPMQAWFFDQPFVDRHHFNQSVCLDVPTADVDPAAAAAATQAVLAHHDALRLRFAQHDGRWTAEYAKESPSTGFSVVDLTDVPVDHEDARLRDAVAACQSGLDLSSGRLLSVCLVKRGQGRPWRLLFVAHHLAVDGVSWRILLGDFSTAYAQHLANQPLVLPAKTTSFRTWTQQLADLAPTIDSTYWRSALNAPVTPLPTDQAYQPVDNTVGSAGDVTRTLDAETTSALLHDVPRIYTTEINDVLLSGLALAFQSWSGHDTLLLDLEAHGRDELLDDVDSSRTVGWFTSQFPVQLTLNGAATPGDAIKSIKEQLRAVPQRGAGYGVLRYLSKDTNVVKALTAQPAPEVLFNYFGQAGRVLAPGLQWALLPGATGGDISPRAVRSHLLEINAMVTDGCLAVTWTFSTAVHQRKTIEDLASRYEQTLRTLVAHCRTATTPQYTPSDFPASGLDQASLDALISKLNR